jgi:thiamine-phosphate pyrophosphorylase
VKPKKEMKLIVITPEVDLQNETKHITEMFQNSLTRLHIRKPAYTISEMKKMIEQIPSEFHKNIVLHQFSELLNEYNLGGFHITQYNWHLVDEIKLNIPSERSISMSCHSFEEIHSLTGFDYYFISPIFNSISKIGYLSNFTNDEIAKGLANNSGKKIIALGGINQQNISLINSLGFEGAALLGSVWQSFNPLTEWIEIYKKTI